ncbi:MAG: MBL fold metallo-hydrolase [Lachnospiraceae bacterium]|nr:MBL fold metallo-hydrolase [Lachnospiraceae bacterium]
MEVTVLVDNNTYIDQYYLGEPGVSYYLETKDRHILFDTGYSNVFWSNAEKMGIDLAGVDTLVLSHGHDDHTGGLTTFLEKHPEKFSLVAHPDCLEEKEAEGLKVCSPIRRLELEGQYGAQCQTVFTKEPYEITPGLFFLGEIPRTVSFEPLMQIGYRFPKGEKTSDYVMDDSALVWVKEDSLFLITGCSHSGICNMITYAEKLFPGKKLEGILGGFHLLKTDRRAEETVRFLSKKQIREFYPCHCTCFAVKAEMYQKLPVKEVGTGMKLTL